MRTGGAIFGVFALLSAAAAARADERLVLEPYPGPPWREVVNRAQGLAFIREQMPANQTPDNFRDALTAQAVPGYRGDPASFISTAFAQFSQQCDTVDTAGPTSVEEQGRPVAYGQFYCGRQKGQAYGVHIFFKAIQGTDALYVVDRDFRTPPSNQARAPVFEKGREKDAIAFLEGEGTADRYLKEQVYLCDPVFPDPRCATPTGASGR